MAPRARAAPTHPGAPPEQRGGSPRGLRWPGPACSEEERDVPRCRIATPQEEELKRLKNLKKAEILDRLQTIQSISGGASALSEVDLSVCR